ncbi:hypothetical protein TREMEDRAFT_59136 [Tremella mesenterica DSM 1558]|uniref:uncharacterized protein n=1 Tax=Tremella mesenterica (strain ATCC 24925 / CBS 8224 / DSM 1558 / NBRC 9311 / NRRL Y-6157 / RJB 2259-6 / UBC 559-6) TaxID=578456 RepID=UPI0003F4A00B|nr:uncharacterized protein TREMEDRAFT_59136 [Tremella mesenterica DSM 1558]EIW72974.1 hypothetical protein TREMEDRAFT_59136 [Tremella mesenterica DSM 1558]
MTTKPEWSIRPPEQQPIINFDTTSSGNTYSPIQTNPSNPFGVIQNMNNGLYFQTQQNVQNGFYPQTQTQHGPSNSTPYFHTRPINIIGQNQIPLQTSTNQFGSSNSGVTNLHYGQIHQPVPVNPNPNPNLDSFTPQSNSYGHFQTQIQSGQIGLDNNLDTYSKESSNTPYPHPTSDSKSQSTTLASNYNAIFQQIPQQSSNSSANPDSQSIAPVPQWPNQSTGQNMNPALAEALRSVWFGGQYQGMGVDQHQGGGQSNSRSQYISQNLTRTNQNAIPQWPFQAFLPAQLQGGLNTFGNSNAPLVPVVEDVSMTNTQDVSQPPDLSQWQFPVVVSGTSQNLTYTTNTNHNLSTSINQNPPPTPSLTQPQFQSPVSDHFHGLTFTPRQNTLQPNIENSSTPRQTSTHTFRQNIPPSPSNMVVDITSTPQRPTQSMGTTVNPLMFQSRQSLSQTSGQTTNVQVPLPTTRRVSSQTSGHMQVSSHSMGQDTPHSTTQSSSHPSHTSNQDSSHSQKQEESHTTTSDVSSKSIHATGQNVQPPTTHPVPTTIPQWQPQTHHSTSPKAPLQAIDKISPVLIPTQTFKLTLPPKASRSVAAEPISAQFNLAGPAPNQWPAQMTTTSQTTPTHSGVSAIPKGFWRMNRPDPLQPTSQTMPNGKPPILEHPTSPKQSQSSFQLKSSPTRSPIPQKESSSTSSQPIVTNSIQPSSNVFPPGFPHNLSPRTKAKFLHLLSLKLKANPQTFLHTAPASVPTATAQKDTPTTLPQAEETRVTSPSASKPAVEIKATQPLIPITDQKDLLSSGAKLPAPRAASYAESSTPSPDTDRKESSPLPSNTTQAELSPASERKSSEHPQASPHPDPPPTPSHANGQDQWSDPPPLTQSLHPRRRSSTEVSRTPTHISVQGWSPAPSHTMISGASPESSRTENTPTPSHEDDDDFVPESSQAVMSDVQLTPHTERPDITLSPSPVVKRELSPTPSPTGPGGPPPVAHQTRPDGPIQTTSPSRDEATLQDDVPTRTDVQSYLPFPEELPGAPSPLRLALERKRLAQEAKTAAAAAGTGTAATNNMSQRRPVNPAEIASFNAFLQARANAMRQAGHIRPPQNFHPGQTFPPNQGYHPSKGFRPPHLIPGQNFHPGQNFNPAQNMYAARNPHLAQNIRPPTSMHPGQNMNPRSTFNPSQVRQRPSSPPASLSASQALPGVPPKLYRRSSDSGPPRKRHRKIRPSDLSVTFMLNRKTIITISQNHVILPSEKYLVREKHNKTRDWIQALDGGDGEPKLPPGPKKRKLRSPGITKKQPEPLFLANLPLSSRSTNFSNTSKSNFSYSSYPSKPTNFQLPTRPTNFQYPSRPTNFQYPTNPTNSQYPPNPNNLQYPSRPNYPPSNRPPNLSFTPGTSSTLPQPTTPTNLPNPSRREEPLPLPTPSPLPLPLPLYQNQKNYHLSYSIYVLKDYQLHHFILLLNLLQVHHLLLSQLEYGQKLSLR